MHIYYTATAKFGPAAPSGSLNRNLNWQSYLAWSKLTHLEEVITLDSQLAPPALARDDQQDAAFLVWADFIPDLYTDAAYLLSRLHGLDPAAYHLLAVAKEPDAPCEAIRLDGFAFAGYDLLDVYGDISALTNCGGFNNAFLPRDLNAYGLVPTYAEAYRIKGDLAKNNPDESHADCHVWAIWRKE